MICGPTILKRKNMAKIIESDILIDDILSGASLVITGQHLVDWSWHDNNYAFRTVGSHKNPKGGIVFIANSEFERLTVQQRAVWSSACYEVDQFLGNFTIS